MNTPFETAGSHRIPVRISLDADDYAFVMSCIEAQEVTSLDALFETALGTFREHLLAFLTWTEGRSDEELKTMRPPLRCTVTYEERTE